MFDYFIIPAPTVKDHYYVGKSIRGNKESREVLIIDSTVVGGVKWVTGLEFSFIGFVPEKSCFPSPALAASVLVASFAAGDGLSNFIKTFRR